jgi:hypothetical protein
MWEVKWHMVIRGIEGEKDWIERPRETEVLVRTYVLSFAEDRADNMLFSRDMQEYIMFSIALKYCND